jgi:hypothetical protein
MRKREKKKKRHCRIKRQLGNLKKVEECESAHVKNRYSKQNKINNKRKTSGEKTERCE